MSNRRHVWAIWALVIASAVAGSNRKRYDAEKAIDTVGARLRDEVDIDALRLELVDIVQRTRQPSTASLWIRQP